MSRVLVVEDDPRIAEALQVLLARSGYEPLVASTGPEAWQAFVQERPDALLLDLALPGLDGPALLARIRASGAETPVLAVTADGSTLTLVHLFEMGIDDYIVKPYRGPEVVARLRAALRRVGAGAAGMEGGRGALALGSLTLDPHRHEVRVAGATVELSRTEFRLLEGLLQQPNAIVPQDEIVRRVWGEGAQLDRSTVKVNVYRLRRKLDAVGRPWGSIRSAAGVGWGLFAR